MRTFSFVPFQNSWLVSTFIKAVSWLWRICALFYVCAFLIFFVPDTINRANKKRDAIIYYETAQKVNQGKPLYTPRPRYGPHTKPFDYLYLPPFAAVIAPLGRLDWVTFSTVWTLFLALCWFGFTATLTLMARGKLSFWPYLETNLMMVLIYGSHRAFSLGQIDPFLWLIFGLGVLAVQRAQTINGLFFGIASVVKIYSIWSVFTLPKNIIRHSWMWAFGFLTISFLFGGLVCGFDSYGQWLHAVPPVVGQGTFDEDNVSISMGVLRLAQLLGWDYVRGPLGVLPKLWLSMATVIGPFMAIILTRKMASEMRVAIVGVVAALFAPICWTSYLPLLLCPLALSLAQFRQKQVSKGTPHAIP